MPKKTRRQKVNAERRRIHQPFPLPLTSTETPETAPNPFRFVFNPKSTLLQKEQPGALAHEEFSAIRRDLIKTLVLAGIAIGVEFFLYWWQLIRP